MSALFSSTRSCWKNIPRSTITLKFWTASTLLPTGGTAREKQSNYPKAVKAYEQAADRYHDQKKVAADAMFKAALAYNKQAKKAEYDQNIAGQAISTFTDFIALYPEDPRVVEAQKLINSLKTEQARGEILRKEKTVEGSGRLLQRSFGKRSKFKIRGRGQAAH